MKPNIVVDASQVTEGLKYLRGSIPSAMNRALRLTARDAQTAQRQGMERRFTIAPARKQFVERLIKITPDRTATGSKIPGQIIGVQGPASELTANSERDRLAQLLTRHEDGGTMNAKDDPFYIPTKVIRPTDTTLVPRGLYPTNLRLAARRTVDGILPALKGGKVKTLGGKNISNRARKQQGLEGLLGTFTIASASIRAAGIYQRTGRDRKQITKIWQFARRVQLKPRLQFEETIARAVNERWTVNAGVAVDEVIAAAFKKGAKNFAAGITDSITDALTDGLL